MRDAAVESKEQRRFARRPGSHVSRPVLVERGGAIVPRQQARVGALRKRGDASGWPRKRIGAVEPGAGEERLRRKSTVSRSASPASAARR